MLPAARGQKLGKALLLGVAAEVWMPSTTASGDGAGAGAGAHNDGTQGDEAAKPDVMHWTTGLQNVWAGRLYDQVADIRHKWYSMDLPYKPRVAAEQPSS